MSATDDSAAHPVQRRRLQFNLRTLMLLALVAGVLLGRYGMRRLEFARERAVLAQLQEYGADVQFRDGRAVQLSFYGEVFEDEALALAARLPRLERIKLIETPLTDAGLKRLAHGPDLQELSIIGGAVTDEGLVHIAGLTNLRKLRLDHTQITDEGLPRLAMLGKLTRLDLAGTRITDAGLKRLAGMTHLEELYLHNTQVTDEGVQALRQRLPETIVVR